MKAHEKHASTIRTNPPRLLSVPDAADGSEAVQSYGDLLDEHIEQDQIAKAQKLVDEIIGANVDLAGENYIPPAEEVDLYRRVAEEGHVDSMLALGMLLRDAAASLGMPSKH